METTKVSCNCEKSKCLKFYCDCIAAGGFCGEGCGCIDCKNKTENEDRARFLKLNSDYIIKSKQSCIETVMLPNGQSIRRHTKGCGCSSSGCVKKYCECFKFKVKCSEKCKCTNDECLNDKTTQPDLSIKTEGNGGYLQPFSGL